MFKTLFKNARKPQKNFFGSLMLQGMNKGHNPLALFGLKHLELENNQAILDIGCGGGKNIQNLLHQAPLATVYGIDHAEASIIKSSKYNKKALALGKVKLQLANAEKLPFEDNSLDTITAFETIYFWPNIDTCFSEIFRCLKPTGNFLICNEAQNEQSVERWIKILEMNVYTGEELQQKLLTKGFSSVEFDNHKNGKWLAVIATK